ncbi:hypothetical protein ANN_03643 [Periplaneta americana]|uniref:Uncharacterized protein n=1 Tax=Periplaneta americana TaxID=6978 RepID=A0ABQ8TZE2_PERAM|nr:hypothetical protein ANN_03643 [Periplaneta americana]
MSPGSSTESYLAFANIGLRENPGKPQPADVERSFSAYKVILSDTRQSFSFETLKMNVVVYCSRNRNLANDMQEKINFCIPVNYKSASWDQKQCVAAVCISFVTENADRIGISSSPHLYKHRKLEFTFVRKSGNELGLALRGLKPGRNFTGSLKHLPTEQSTRILVKIRDISRELARIE